MSARRKAEHLKVALDCDLEAKREACWSDVHLLHECLPEIDQKDINLRVEFCGRVLNYPLMINAITGGCSEAVRFNEVFAQAAEHFGIGMGLGSQSPLLDSPELEYTYTVARKTAPSAFLVANIGASRLVEQSGDIACTIDQIQHIIEIVHADALAIHLNFLQESVMPEGDRKAKGCIEAIRRVSEELAVPVFMKETGAGISAGQAAQLSDCGVSALDIGGAGGTSMALLESHRARMNNNLKYEVLGSTLAHWGIPTVVSLMEARSSGLPIIASGGITNGLDAAKALALGADLVGVAGPILHAAAKGYQAVLDWLDLFFSELSVVMFLTSAPSIKELQKRKLIILGSTREWLEQLGHDISGICNERLNSKS
ncbi:type 2 isopentenyl-diphosphate Delta-isomerase [Chloroflexota bacterium]